MGLTTNSFRNRSSKKLNSFSFGQLTSFLGSWEFDSGERQVVRRKRKKEIEQKEESWWPKEEIETFLNAR